MYLKIGEEVWEVVFSAWAQKYTKKVKQREAARRDITLLAIVFTVEPMSFPRVSYGCENRARKVEKREYDILEGSVGGKPGSPKKGLN